MLLEGAKFPFASCYCLSHDRWCCVVVTNEFPDINDFPHKAYLSFMLSVQLTFAECLLHRVPQRSEMMVISPRQMFWLPKQGRPYMEFSFYFPILWHRSTVHYIQSQPLAEAFKRELGNLGECIKSIGIITKAPRNKMSGGIACILGGLFKQQTLLNTSCSGAINNQYTSANRLNAIKETPDLESQKLCK